MALYLPFLIAVGLETLLGRPSAPLGEVVALTVACGVALGTAVAAAWTRLEGGRLSRRETAKN